MSIDNRQRSLRQRRLGVLRNFHQTDVLSEPRNRAQTAPVNATSMEATPTSESSYREKLRKLQQIRSENAKTQQKVNCGGSETMDMPRARCSTAPKNSLIFNREKILTCSSLEGNALFKKYLIKNEPERISEPKHLDRKESYPPIQRIQQNNVRSKTPPAIMKRTWSASSKRKHQDSFQSMKNALTGIVPSKCERTTSAPAKSHETVHRFQSETIFSQRHSSINKDQIEEAKRATFTPLPRPPKRIPNLPSAKMYTTRGGLIRLDEGPLGVVGRPWTPRLTPQLLRTPYRPPVITLRRSVSLPLKINKKEVFTPPEPPNSPRTLCLVPNTSKNNSTCNCRSVRFSCSDDLVHEFQANEPIVSASEAFTN